MLCLKFLLRLTYSCQVVLSLFHSSLHSTAPWMYAWRETICQGWISHDTPVKESCEPRHFWCSNERSLWWAEQPDRFWHSIQWGPLAFVAFGLAIQNLIWSNSPNKSIGLLAHLVVNLISVHDCWCGVRLQESQSPLQLQFRTRIEIVGLLI